MSGIMQRDTLDRPEAAVSVTTALTVVIGPLDLLRFATKAFTIKNGATAFNAAVVEATRIEPTPGAPSTDDADWETIDGTTFATLGAAGIKSLQISDDSRKWWRVRAKVAAGTSTARGYTTAG